MKPCSNTKRCACVISKHASHSRKTVQPLFLPVIKRLLGLVILHWAERIHFPWYIFLFLIPRMFHSVSTRNFAKQNIVFRDWIRGIYYAKYLLVGGGGIWLPGEKWKLKMQRGRGRRQQCQGIRGWMRRSRRIRDASWPEPLGAAHGDIGGGPEDHRGKEDDQEGTDESAEVAKLLLRLP